MHNTQDAAEKWYLIYDEESIFMNSIFHGYSLIIAKYFAKYAILKVVKNDRDLCTSFTK